MSELDWTNRLLHLRFSRAILFFEKWLSFFFVSFLLILSMPWPIVSVVAFVCSVFFLLAYSSHFNLEEAAGMPVNYVTVKY